MFPSQYIRVLLIWLVCGLCSPVLAQKPVLCESYEEVEKIVEEHLNAQRTVVLNFWATWCGPCIEELPYFEKLNQVYGNEGVTVILISLDFKTYHEKKVIPFVEEKELKSDVLHLVDMDNNTWMPKVHEEWDGAVPITVVISGKQRKLFDDKFVNYLELENFVRPFLAYNPKLNDQVVDSAKK